MADHNKLVEILKQTSGDEMSLQRDAVLKIRMNWKAFEGTYIDARAVRMISEYDSGTFEQRKVMFEKDGEQYATILVNLLGQAQQQDHLKYLLLLVEEIFEDMPIGGKTERIGYFLSLRNIKPDLPMGNFLKLLDYDDQFLQYLAANQCGTLLFYENEKFTEKDGEGLLRWIVATLRKAEDRKDRHSQRSAVKCLQNVLQRDQMRVKFDNFHGLALLSSILNVQCKAVVDAKQLEGAENETGRDLQLIYETLFCCWLLSFNVDIAEKNFTGTSIILNTVRIMREVDKEKIRRVGLAMLRNLSGKAQNDEAMIHAGFWKVVQQFAVKRWGDEDILGDVQVLLEKMEAKMIDMTTWDRYKQELLSGQLEWSPAHKSEKFWKENWSRFNDKDFELVGVLAALLNSKEPLTVAIACHDLGEFGRFHPLGKKIIMEHNIKTKILGMIDAQDLLIQQQALLSLQKLMISNWEHLGQVGGQNKNKN